MVYQLKFIKQHGNVYKLQSIASAKYDTKYDNKYDLECIYDYVFNREGVIKNPKIAYIIDDIKTIKKLGKHNGDKNHIDNRIIYFMTPAKFDADVPGTYENSNEFIIKGKKYFGYYLKNVNCRKCVDCIACRDSVNCKRSINLLNCRGCVECDYSGDCTGCVNCDNCHDCKKCTNCSYCWVVSELENCTLCEDDCINCKNCTDCVATEDCKNCTDCRFSDHLINCTGCNDCSDCKNCTSCDGCDGLRNKTNVKC